jgi:allophanate hydrolase
VTETVAEILAAYRSSALTPTAIVARSYSRLRERRDPAIFISLRKEEDVLAEAETLMKGGNDALPLYGVPVAVKDPLPAGTRCRRGSAAARSRRARPWQDQS